MVKSEEVIEVFSMIFDEGAVRQRGQPKPAILPSYFISKIIGG